MKLIDVHCPRCTYLFQTDRAAGVVTCTVCFLEIEVGVRPEHHYVGRAVMAGVAPVPDSRRPVARAILSEDQPEVRPAPPIELPEEIERVEELLEEVKDTTLV